MSEKSNIEWTESTWNPWYGCTKISPGCKFCYMYRDMERYGRDPHIVTRSKTKFNDPLKWAQSGKPPKFCFTCSWSDFFIEQADQWRPEAWAIIKQTPQITYQILTKRPELVKDRLPADWGEGYPNVWLGVSAENQKYADERVPILLTIPARIRWISAEPLLGPIDFSKIVMGDGDWLSTLYNYAEDAGIDWVVTGGESGPAARPMNPDWVRSIRDQCRAAGVAYFHKQNGEYERFGMCDSASEGEDIGEVAGRFIAGDYDEQLRSRWVYKRVGKKAAGRLLDGIEHNAYPQLRAEAAK